MEVLKKINVKIYYIHDIKKEIIFKIKPQELLSNIGNTNSHIRNLFGNEPDGANAIIESSDNILSEQDNMPTNNILVKHCLCFIYIYNISAANVGIRCCSCHRCYIKCLQKQKRYKANFIYTTCILQNN